MKRNGGMRWGTSRPFWFALACAVALACPRAAAASTTTMVAVSDGTDGPFSTVTLAGKTVYQSKDLGNGSYSGLMYFKRPAGVSFAAGTTLYMEVDYQDTGGVGSFGAQYNAVGNDYARAFGLGNVIRSSGAYLTAAFRLDNADLRYAQNGGTDLRLTQPSSVQLNIVEVRVSDQPSAIYNGLSAFLGPYTGPTYVGGTPVDATTMKNKILCGYQGWFRAPGDDDGTGWQHYIADWGGTISPPKIAIDYWPEMLELGPSEQYKADGFTVPGGAQATLFSSDNTRSVLRHFQWMEAYGIDGVAVQRFMPSDPPDVTSQRVLSDIRAAANLTGRTFFIEYDMTGTAEADLVPTITRDWHYLVDSMKLTADKRYLQEGGIPVIGIFGFYRERFTTATANAILDIFKGPGPYQAFVAGAGAWYWNIEPYPDDWKNVIYRMGSFQPWNTGNSGSGNPPNTSYWEADKAALAAHGVMYVPQVYPGSSDFNRSGRAWGPSTEDRQAGSFLWPQLAQAAHLNVDSIFVGMFDEMDEGTQIFKVSQTPPAEAHFRTYDGLPSDAYLCFVGQGIRMLRKEIPYSTTKPDCAAMTQPSIPDAIAPLNGDTVNGPAVVYRFSAAIALALGGTIDHYDLWLDGSISRIDQANPIVSTAPGAHVWRARAVNSLGNAGGWSIGQSFTVADAGTTVADAGTSGSAGGDPADGGAGGMNANDAGSVSSGCGCHLGGASSDVNVWSLLFLAALLTWRWRRHKRAGSA